GRKLQAHSFGVPVHYRYAIAVRADLRRQRLDVVALEIAQDLLRLLLHLLLFTTDERHHVADNIHGGDARIARAADRLHRAHQDLGDAELLQRPERHYQA